MEKYEKSMFYLLIVLCIIGTSQAFAQIPGSAVPANPNVVYYAGGQTTFYNVAGIKVLDVDAAEAVWSCSPAKAAWVVVTPKSGGYYEFPNYTNTLPRVSHAEMMRPFWTGDTIFKEAVVLKGPSSSSQLLYTPKQILSVANYNGSAVYHEGLDYQLDGRNIKQISSAPSKTYVAKQGQRGNGTPNGLINVAATSWTYVTYIPDRSDWDGPRTTWKSKSNLLPRTTELLRQGKPLVVQALGMSLTAGLNVSGFAGDAKNFPPTDPFMLSYVDLFCEEMRLVYGSNVTLFNSSCGGKTMSWADKYCTALVNPNNPDLVMIDMGMNDIWGQTTENGFRSNLESTISKIRAECPNAEFVLIANMLPDVTGTGAPADGETWMYRFLNAMNAQEASGCAVFDMTTMSDKLFDRKSPACFTSNSLHPNDYMARWYAQGLSQLISPVTTSVDQDEKAEADAPTISITPVPSSAENGNIQIANCSGLPVHLFIADALGRTVYEQESHRKDLSIQITDLHLTEGWYVVTAATRYGSTSRCLLIR